MKDAHVLLVEDDFIVGLDMQVILEEQGAHVLGPAASLEEAGRLLAMQTPDVAVLDINLNGEFVFPLVSLLQERGVPFFFATAYADDDRVFPADMEHVPRLAKPVLPHVLIAQVARSLKHPR